MPIAVGVEGRQGLVEQQIVRVPVTNFQHVLYKLVNVVPGSRITKGVIGIIELLLLRNNLRTVTRASQNFDGHLLRTVLRSQWSGLLVAISKV